MRRVLLAVAIFVVLLLMVTVAGVMWIGSTQSGTQWLAQRALAWLPDTVTVGEVSGRSFSPLQLRGVTVKAGAAQVELQNLQLDWQPSRLLAGDLRIMRLAADGVTVVLPPPAAPEEEPDRAPRPFSVPALQLPVDVELVELRISELRVVQSAPPAAPVFSATSINAAARLNDAGVALESLRIASPLIDLQAEGFLASAEPRQTQLDASVNLRLPDQPALAADLGVRGPLAYLTLQLDLTAPTAATVTANVRDLTVAAVPSWTVQARVVDTALNRVNPTWPALTIAAELDATGSGAQQARATTQVTVQHPQATAVATADTAWNGTVLTVSPFTVALPQPGATATAWGSVTPQRGQPRVDVTLVWNNLRWPLQDAPQVMSPGGELMLTGTPADYQFQVSTQLATAQLPDAALTANGRGDTSHLHLSSLNVDVGETHAAASGTFGWKEGFHFAAAGDWQKLRWPLANQGPPATVASEAGHFHGAGTLESFALAVDGDVLAPGAPPLMLELGGVGSTAHLDIARLHSEVIGGTVDVVGHVAWRDGVRWNAQVAGKHLDLARWRDLPSSDLALRLHSQGALHPQHGLETVAELQRLSGKLAMQDVNASAQLSVARDTIKIDPLQLRVGASTAFVQGSLGETMDLQWKVQGRELHLLDDRLAGDLRVEGRMSGFRAAPHVDLRASGTNLRALTGRLASIELDAAATLDVANIDRARLTLLATGLGYNNYQIDQLLLRAQGDGTAQNAVLALAGGEHGATFALTGAAVGKAWEGAIESGIVTWTPDLTWRPSGPTKLHVESGKVRLDRACWTSEQGSACAAGEHNRAGPWRIALRAPELGLQLFQRWVPTQIALAGAVDVNVSAQGNAGDIHGAESAIEFDEALLRSDDPFGPPTEVKFSSAKIHANLNERALDLTAGLKLTPGGTFQARAHVPAPALFLDPTTAPIDAQLDVKLDQLDALGTLVPKISDVKGSVVLTASLTGTAQDPQLKGRLDLKDGALDVPGAGLEVRDLTFNARAKSIRDVVLSGSAHSGDGDLTLSGTAGIRDDGLLLKANLRGENFTAVHTRELRALVSPDLTLITSSDGTTITGTVRIPESTIRIKKPKGTVEASNDVVVIDRQNSAQPTPHRIAMQVRVELGDRVNMDAFNLRAHLGGGAQITMEPSKPAVGVGTFTIDEGFYEAWGVALRIERGHVVYVNSPLNNPGLDIRATRKAGDVLTGLNVRGTLADPKVEIFSEPPMNESDAFSYLIFGRPLSQSTSADAGEGLDAVNAARSMGLEIAAQRLSQKLGLDDVRVQTDEEGNSTVVMGRYLSPKVYVGYGVDVVDQLTSFHLDYLLSRRWTIRTQTSAAATAADLMFSLDSD